MPVKKGKQAATKEDVDTAVDTAKVELREEIVQVRRDLGMEIFKTNERIDRAENSLAEAMRRGFDQVNRTIDSFLKKLETYARESVTFPRALDEHGKTLKDHESRLVSLESSRPES